MKLGLTGIKLGSGKRVKCISMCKECASETYQPGTSLVVRWLRHHAPNAGGLGSIPGQGT